MNQVTNFRYELVLYCLQSKVSSGTVDTCIMLRHPLYVYGAGENLVPSKLHLGEFLVRKLKAHADEIALINGSNDKRSTYGQILQAAMNLAVSLVKVGVQKGDVVAICSETRWENWPTVIGISCTGASMTPMYVMYIKDELKRVLDISKPKYLFCSLQAFKTHKEIFKSLDMLRKIILFGDERMEGTMLFKDLAEAAPESVIQKNISYEDFEPVAVDGKDDTAFIMYSSGTTGLPKGVMHSHLNVIIALSLSGVVIPKFTAIYISPWCHMYGLVTGLIFMCHGSKVVFLPRFEIDLYLRCIEKYKVNHLLLVPSILVALLRTQFSYDVSSVQAVLSATFVNLRYIYQGYGLTETAYAITLDSVTDGKLCKPGSIGAVVPESVIKIVDINSREPLGPHKNGELFIKSPLIMKGYIGKDLKEELDDEGFFRSGDICYYDDDGYLYIVGRLKEIVKYKGFQVSLAEIEEVLLQHPAVREACVVGLPNVEAGEVPFAFVVAQLGSNPTQSELQQFVAERLSNPKRLRGGVRFVDEIPRSMYGKVLRNKLQEMLD